VKISRKAASTLAAQNSGLPLPLPCVRELAAYYCVLVFQELAGEFSTSSPDKWHQSRVHILGRDVVAAEDPVQR
jgi:hypothetical protein